MKASPIRVVRKHMKVASDMRRILRTIQEDGLSSDPAALREFVQVYRRDPRPEFDDMVWEWVSSRLDPDTTKIIEPAIREMFRKYWSIASEYGSKAEDAVQRGLPESRYGRHSPVEITQVGLKNFTVWGQVPVKISRLRFLIGIYLTINPALLQWPGGGVVQLSIKAESFETGPQRSSYEVLENQVLPAVTQAFPGWEVYQEGGYSVVASKDVGKPSTWKDTFEEYVRGVEGLVLKLARESR